MVLSRAADAPAAPAPRHPAPSAPALRPAETREQPMQPDAPLFSWIHLSDIHFGHGTPGHRWDQEIVLKALAADAKTQAGGQYPSPQAILITGDIAFSGAGLSADEYERAEAWLKTLTGPHGLADSAIFLVPGNHDVNRGVEKGDRDVRRLLDAILQGNSLDDEAIAHRADLERLERRQRSYLDFATRLAPSRGHLWWTHSIPLPGLRLRLVGLNTALVAAGPEDQGRLQVGNHQLAKLLGDVPDDDEVVVVLTHHPVTKGWLRDERTAAAQIRTHSHIHLAGHIHEASSLHTRVGGSARTHLQILAGAVHGEAGEVRDFGYRACALLWDERGLVLRIWPRKWSDTHRAFRLDSDWALDGQQYDDHVVKPGWRPAQPRPQ